MTTKFIMSDEMSEFYNEVMRMYKDLSMSFIENRLRRR